MDLGYWINFIMVFALGVILVQISHGKILNSKRMSVNFSLGFLKLIRYIGLFVIVYSCYAVMIDVVIGY
ncbi:hypothetical protein FMO003_15340 [Moritella sp. F3]|nr:hypothetical protein FMO001_37890 [Moritella sp. F1]GIC81253.1 hypothetical protein FMO003_15340 [Moritella sp. F3]